MGSKKVIGEKMVNAFRKFGEKIRGVSGMKKIMVAKEDYRLGNKLNWVDGISCCRAGSFGC